MVNHKRRLKFSIFIRLVKADANQVLINITVNGPVNQAAIYRVLVQMGQGRMRVLRRVGPGRQTINHGRPPGVTTKQPVEICLGKLLILLVPAQLMVQVCLYRKRSSQVIGTPDKRDSPVKSVLPGLLPNLFQSFLIIAHCFSG
ncbi:hypothetical protein D3C86_1724240 [compost metagenome]